LYLEIEHWKEQIMRFFVAVSPLFASLFLMNCGPELANVDAGSEGSKVVFTENDLINVRVNVADTQFAFALADATDYTIVLEGCISGLTGSANSTTNTLRAYKFDQGCLAKLTSFSIGLDTYVPSVGNSFTSWLQGDSAIFENSQDATDTLQVTVASQLSNPVATTDTISYGFSEVADGGTTNIAKETVSDSHAITVSGEQAPPFSILGVRFVGITADGSGEFEFDLECDQALSGSGLTALCGSVVLSDIRYTLVGDSFGGVLPTAAQIAAALTAESRTIVAGEVNGSMGSNGGFFTKTKASGFVLKGPATIANNSQMVLMVEQNGSSTIYQIDVASILTND